MWTSPVAQLLDPVSDLPAASRLFGLYALGERMDKALAGDLDPAWVRTRLAVAAEARMLEAALGLSPRSRLALGLALLAGKKAGSLDDLADDAND